MLPDWLADQLTLLTRRKPTLQAASTGVAVSQIFLSQLLLIFLSQLFLISFMCSPVNDDRTHDSNCNGIYVSWAVYLNAPCVPTLKTAVSLEENQAWEFEKVLGEYWASMAGVQGPPRPWWGAGANTLLGGQGAKPPGWKQIWVFWRPVCCLPVHRNHEKKNSSFSLKHQNQHFITFSITPTNFLNYQHINYYQTAKVIKCITFLWNTFQSTRAWATIYRTIRADSSSSFPPKGMNSISIMKKPLESAVLANIVTA